MTPEEIEMPNWLPESCPVYDWCFYNGIRYFGVLNWGESERRQKPVIDLAYCATKGMNGIFLMQRIFSKRFNKPLTPNDKSIN